MRMEHNVMRVVRWILLLATLVVVACATYRYLARPILTGSPFKVYVMLGFHTSFYHSWRGDTPDEAGFGTDIRIVREILRMLDEANAQGLQAKGYWEADNLFTLGNILPKHA